MAVFERQLKLRNAVFCCVALFFGFHLAEAREPAPEEARERLKFSNPFEGLRVPEREKNEPGRTRRFLNNEVTADRGLGGGSLAPVVPSYVPPAPRTVPDRKTLELQDQRRNWIFAQPEGSEPKQSVEEMFGVREVDLQGRDRRFQSVIGKYLENETGTTGDRPALESNHGNFLQPAEDLRNADRFHGNSTSLAPLMPGAVPESTLRLNAPAAAVFSGWQADAAIERLRPNALPDQNPHRNGTSDFRRNSWEAPWERLNAPATANIGSGVFDPIHSMRDSTAQPIHPITPSFAPAVPNALSASTTPWDDRFQTPVPGGRLSSLDEFNARVSTGPAPSSQSLLPDSRTARSQPVVIPPPRRHF
jgi:hypothetical protein